MSGAALRDRAKAHFAAHGQKSIDVPEWGGRIWYRVPNLSTIKDVHSAANGDAIEMQARLVVALATTENGERIWPNKAEYRELMIECDPGVVARIANAMMADAKLDVPAAEGN